MGARASCPSARLYGRLSLRARGTPVRCRAVTGSNKLPGMSRLPAGFSGQAVITAWPGTRRPRIGPGRKAARDRPESRGPGPPGHPVWARSGPRTSSLGARADRPGSDRRRRAGRLARRSRAPGQGVRRPDHHAGRGAPSALRPPAAVQEADDGRAGLDLAGHRRGRSPAWTCGSARPPPAWPGRSVRSDRGEYRFDRLIVATGAAPVRLPGPGRQHVLRTLDDALDIRARLRKGTRLAIVGAGWIGAELATAAVARGCDVTVLEAAATPAAAALGEVAGATMVPWYAAAGVDLRLGQPVESVQEGGLALPGGGVAGGRPDRDRGGGPPLHGMAGRVRGGPGQRDRRRRPPAGLRARGLRGRRLRRVLVRPLRPAAAGGALGYRPALAQRWPRPTRSAPSRTTTRCPISGPSNSAGWSSTWATMIARTVSSGVVIRLGSAGRRAGCPGRRALRRARRRRQAPAAGRRPHGGTAPGHAAGTQAHDGGPERWTPPGWPTPTCRCGTRP